MSRDEAFSPEGGPELGGKPAGPLRGGRPLKAQPWDRRRVRKATRSRARVEATPLRGYVLTLARFLGGERAIHPRHPEPRPGTLSANHEGALPRAARRPRKEDRHGPR